MITDSHTHVLSGDRDRYPRRADAAPWFHGAGDAGVDALLAAMDGAGVAEAVVVQFVGAYGYDCRYAADAVAAGAGRLRLCVAVDMAGDDPAGQLRALARSTPVAGVRAFGVGAEGAAWLTDGRGDALWCAAGETGTTVVATVWGHDLHHLRPLAVAHPDVPIAVDHCGFVDLASDPEPLLSLADLPAVHVKVSTHVLGPLDEPADAVDLLARTFGADRLAWGSDHPQTAGTYDGMVALARHASRRLDEPARAAFLGGTARRLWFR